MTDQGKISSLRSVLTTTQTFLRNLSHVDTDELLNEIATCLQRTEERGPQAWKPGYVFTHSKMERVTVGQRWVYYLSGTSCIYLDVIAVHSDGEVQLRAIDAESLAKYDSAFPNVSFEKGNPSPAPFKRIDARMAKSDPTFREGDFLVHQAWSCWETMDSGNVIAD